MADWTTMLREAMKKQATACGCNIDGLDFEGCYTERTWGDRMGLAFFGASPEVCERAARFFEKWAAQNAKDMGIGDYSAQRSIAYEGPFYYVRFSNGASGWYRGTTEHKVGDVERKPAYVNSEGREVFPAYDLKTEEVRHGFATSYAYYPCAD